MKNLNEKAQKLRKELTKEIPKDLKEYLKEDKDALKIFNALCQSIAN